MSSRESKPQTCPAALMTEAGQWFDCDNTTRHHVVHTVTARGWRWVDDRDEMPPPSPHRFRRLAVLAAFGALLAAATLSTGTAKADPKIDQYTINNAPIICTVLDAYPSIEGVEGVVEAIISKGLTPRQAGEVVARSVIGWCPSHAPEVDGFIQKWTPAGTLQS